MPGMFSRRRGSASQAHTAPPSSSAAIAASSAFLKNSASTNSLSSAAAAAALRSQTTSPEPIGNIQTKRMVRRGSVSSIGSSVVNGGRGGPQMTRRGSQSSMTELPAISTPSHGSVRRSASVEPPIQRVISPTPPRGSRGVSLDRTSLVGNGKRISSLPKLPELERENSSRSINFSRPMASPSVSPPTSPTRPQTAGSWFGPPNQSNGTPRSTLPTRPVSTVGLSNGEISGIQNDVQSAADKPVKKKKKSTAPQQGNHLSTGSMTTAPQGTAVSGNSVAQNSSAPSSRPQSPALTAASKASMVNTATPLASSQTVPTTATPNKKKKKQSITPTVDISDDPPPRNPARNSPPSPTTTRASRALQKQPSIVREDREAEEFAETAQDSSYPRFGSMDMSSSSRASSVIQTSEGPAIPYTANKTRPGRAASLEVPDSHHKSAHFNTVMVDANGVRHIPPPRSVSPAKSALKHSPASSIRTSSPQAMFNSPRPPASDTSDTTSLASQDGYKAGKRKKSVRVSFEADVMGSTPEPKVQETPDVRRSLSPSLAADDEMEDLMKPRPALPSFGSVRKSSSPARSQLAEKVTETLPASTSAAAVSPRNGSASSDHALGAVFANDHAKKTFTASNVEEPLPPNVTTVEESGYQSSDSSHYSDDEMTTETAPVARKDHVSNRNAEPAELANSTSNAGELMVPDIAILPATPGVEEETKAPLELPVAQKSYVMPGGWGEAEEPDHQNERDTESPVFDAYDGVESPSPLLDPIRESDSDDSDAFSDAAEDPSEFEGGFASLDAIVHSPFASPASKNVSATQDSPLPPTAELSSDEEDDQDETKGDWSKTTAYWSSLSKTHREQLEQQAVVTQPKPSPVLSEEPKKKKKPKAVAEVQASPVTTLKPALKQTPKQAPKQKAVQVQRQVEEPAMRKSMRAPQQQAPRTAPEPATAEPVSMRKSMRSEGSARATGGSMRSSMRDGQGAKGRPQSMQAPVQQQGALQKKSMRPASMGNTASSSLPASASTVASRQGQNNRSTGVPTSYNVPKMQGDDSDSESSFRKKRRPSTSTVDSMGKYNMRRSMRAGSLDVGMDRRPMSPSGPPASSKWSIRSSSPPASANRGNFRQSLRKGSMDDTPTMRGNNSKARARDSKSPSRFSVSSFRSSKPAAAPPPAAKSKASGFRSRFNDSDDEDDAPASRPTGGFRSRFADSDDEADSPTVPHTFVPADMTPVRGIPRRRNQDDADSTDLDDSEDEATARGSKISSGRSKKAPLVPSQMDIDKVMEQARRNVAAQTGNDSIAMAEAPATPRTGKRVTLRTEPEPDSSPRKGVDPSVDGLNKRRGLLGSIFGRKRSESSSTLPRFTEPMSTVAEPASPSTPRGGKLQRRNTGQLSRTNSATPGTLVTNASTPGTATQNNQNWPLPPPIPESEPVSDRPNTSDGTLTTKQSSMALARPDVGKRSQSGLLAGQKMVDQNPAYSDRTGKKKRFGKLRKAFGLDD